MGKLGAKGGRKKVGNSERVVTPEVTTDSQAKNLLSFKKVQYAGVSKGNKTKNRLVDKGTVHRQAPKKRVYTEKELGIPKLNKSLDPVGVAVKGKKGKKFVTDSILSQIVAEVNEECNASNASKLERARQLEEIRQHKREEMEAREQEKIKKLEKKKEEARKKGKGKASPNTGDTEGESKPQRKRTVRFS